ncbi:CinA family protein [Rhizobium rosettiformans]|uniref:CinA family protein n=1 Tax=Rhizobium rosettiformans TaxID=1368430 RepID=UPI00285EE858|nr:CinA family protein [Rhizobium rosettiformans]MDR7027583.1 nicotinamide-nucleotide amidase [Rhizobium rosettiformans]MDR7066147.1 nicotinamide-nucleotide amidase [Rhizobium rosettiformans]
MGLYPAEIENKAQAIITAYRELGWMIATAESCTGGLIAGVLTEIAGSSAVVDRGFVTYTNQAKMDLIGVSGKVLEVYGAVSRETALQMAHGALMRSDADVAVAVTGIAGPGGGSAEKPVGLVHLALKTRSGLIDHRDMHYGDIGRSEVRLATIRTALEMLSAAAQTPA